MIQTVFIQKEIKLFKDEYYKHDIKNNLICRYFLNFWGQWRN